MPGATVYKLNKKLKNFAQKVTNCFWVICTLAAAAAAAAVGLGFGFVKDVQAEKDSSVVGWQKLNLFWQNVCSLVHLIGLFHSFWHLIRLNVGIKFQ